MGYFKKHSYLLAAGVISAGLLATLVSCGSGSTDGGGAAELAQVITPMNNDQGAGGSIGITVVDGPSLNVTERTGFKVTLKDPRGQPLQYIRIMCESEKGIAILEPSSGGVAFEHTDSAGNMSGKIGGLHPGSYIMECRAPDGFNLVARTTVIIKGDVPVDFIGFPGAAGGNLGGGLIVDQTPPDDELNQDNGSVRIVKVEYSDGPNMTSEYGPIDLVQEKCDIKNTPNDKDDDVPEPFWLNPFEVTFSNTLLQSVFIDSVDINIGNSAGTSIQTAYYFTDAAKRVEVASQGTGAVTGLLTEFRGGGSKLFVGTDAIVQFGTYRIDFVVTGVTADGRSFTVNAGSTLTFDDVDRCGDL